MHWINGFGGGWMMILWGIIIIGLIAILVRLFSGRNNRPDVKSAMDILKERYAKGEINTEEFKEKKNELIE